MEICSLEIDCRKEMDEFKWIESERAGYDLGEMAIRRWVQHHWNGYLRARWIEHLLGTRFWMELDRGDFKLFKFRFEEEQQPLLERILDLLKLGQENLNIINWAIDLQLPMTPVLDILEIIDINSRRLIHKFDN